MLVSGQRGFGKTVLLTEFARIADAQGWITVRETAAQGMCERIIQALAGHAPRVSDSSVEPTISIAGTAGGSLGHATLTLPSSLGIRQAVNKRLERLKPGKGVLITVDEAQAAKRDELVALATAVQQIIGDQDMTQVSDEEKHGIAFAFAGLPSVVDDLINDEVLTFL